jgi:hypothetical protein
MVYTGHLVFRILECKRYTMCWGCGQKEQERMDADFMGKAHGYKIQLEDLENDQRITLANEGQC